MEGIARDDELLFSESAGRFVVTVRPDNAAAFEKALSGTDRAKVGVVTENCELTLRGLGGREVVRGSLERLKAAWQAPLANI